MKKTRIAIAITSTIIASSAFATNGMNMEGYGPVSTAMGGTAQAYDNGLGGMMNNPATMGMDVSQGQAFQIAIGGLNPTISSENKKFGVKTDSTGSFIMPGFGYARKNNGFVWGVGVMSQGGMGTDYGKATSTTDLFAGGMSTQGLGQTGDNAFAAGTPQAATQTALSGAKIKSEVGVGRLVVPLAFDISDKLTVGASIDYVWGGMDLQMDMDGGTFNQLMSGNGGSVAGSMATGLQNFMAAGSMGNYINQQSGGSTTVPSNGPAVINKVNYARFDFDDGSNFTQSAKGAGLAGKLGFTYKLSNKIAFGASYHSKTAMSDFEGDAKMAMGVSMGTPNNVGVITYGDTSATLTGKIKVKDFQWPETYALGMSYRGSDKWMLSADVKQINWAAVMKQFSMSFTADATQSGTLASGFAGKTIDVTLDQNWKDQTVMLIGGQYQATKKLAVRAGYNYASNPVPDATLNALFPATITSHYTGGVGYQLNKENAVDFSLTIAPEVSATNSNTGTTTTHSQMNWQLMYSYIWGVK